MTPQVYELDVHVGTRKLDDQTMLVVLDWSPDSAVFTRRQLNVQLRIAAEANRAVGSDLREYSLRAFRVDDRGDRITGVPVWSWRYQPDPVEADRDGWWRL